MAELVIMKAARELSLLQVGGNVFVGHFLETCLKKVELLRNSASVHNGFPLNCFPPWAHTSSSLHALPPPVEVAFLFFVTPYS